MKLDAKGRSERARNAALVAASNRQSSKVHRDIGIMKTYLRLTGGKQTKQDDIDSIKFLREHGFGPNLSPDETVWQLLAKVTNLTEKRIRQIVSLNTVKQREISSLPLKIKETRQSKTRGKCNILPESKHGNNSNFINRISSLPLLNIEYAKNT